MFDDLVFQCYLTPVRIKVPGEGLFCIPGLVNTVLNIFTEIIQFYRLSNFEVNFNRGPLLKISLYSNRF